MSKGDDGVGRKGLMENKITRIEITFPEPVEIASDTYRAFVELADEVCRDYEAANPQRIMWPAGIGGKMTGNWMFDDDDLEFDMTVLAIDCSERERFDDERKVPDGPGRREILAALDDYNSLLRSAKSIADRAGAETAWEAFASRLDKVLRAHHQTWRIHSPWLAAAQAMSAGTAETLQAAQGQRPASAVGSADAPDPRQDTPETPRQGANTHD